MSLFQCDHCGCLDNTALGGGYHMRSHFQKREDGLYKEPAVVASYKVVLGIPQDQELGTYCAACNPVWYTEGGRHHGVGPRPEGYTTDDGENMGKWHDVFERTYLPKGLFGMNGDGNLAHVETLDTNVDKYALPGPEDIVLPPYFRRVGDHMLPRPSEEEACARYLASVNLMLNATKNAPEHLRPRDEATRRCLSMHFAMMATMTEEDRQKREYRQELRREEGLRSITDNRKSIARSAGAMALAAAVVGMGHKNLATREALPPKPPTPGDLERQAQASAAKLAKAQAKRKMRLGKRQSSLVPEPTIKE